jgi:hypothetical protein
MWEAKNIYTHSSTAIFFEYPAVWWSGSGIHVISTISWEDITLHIVHYISV